MKKYLIAPFLLGASLNLSAQCTDYDCEDATLVDVEDGLSNYEGSVCFTGIGTVTTACNVNNWEIMSVSGQIDYLQKINFNSWGTKLFSQGNNSFDYWSMDGGDTVYVKSGVCQTSTIITNNSWDGNWNTVVVDEGAEFYFSGILYDPWAAADGVITLSVAGGDGNKLKIIRGCYSIPLPIKSYFKASLKDCRYFLEWDAPEAQEVIIQAKDTGDWKLINSEGQLDLPTYFRLLIDGYYTPIEYLEPCNTKVEIYPNPADNQIFIKGKVNNYSVQEYTGKVLLVGYDNQINLNLLSSGTYLLTINNSQTFKIVKK